MTGGHAWSQYAAAAGGGSVCALHGGGRRCEYTNCAHSAAGRTNLCKTHGVLDSATLRDVCASARAESDCPGRLVCKEEARDAAMVAVQRAPWAARNGAKRMAVDGGWKPTRSDAKRLGLHAP
jgi:hypothetical protein